jgi:hypothetical protein
VRRFAEKRKKKQNKKKQKKEKKRRKEKGDKMNKNYAERRMRHPVDVARPV